MESRKEDVEKMLPKNQEATNAAMLEWMTDNHTEAILKDKYDNRKRTGISIGAAVILTVAAHGISAALAARSGAESAPSSGGGAEQGGGNVSAPEASGTTGLTNTGGASEVSGGGAADLANSGGGEAASAVTSNVAPVEVAGNAATGGGDAVGGAAGEAVGSQLAQPSNAEMLQLVKDTIRGKFGNGEVRREALGDLYQAVQRQVNLNINSFPKGATIYEDQVRLFN